MNLFLNLSYSFRIKYDKWFLWIVPFQALYIFIFATPMSSFLYYFFHYDLEKVMQK